MYTPESQGSNSQVIIASTKQARKVYHMIKNV